MCECCRAPQGVEQAGVLRAADCAGRAAWTCHPRCAGSPLPLRSELVPCALPTCLQAIDPNLLKLKQAFEIAAEKMGLLAGATGEPTGPARWLSEKMVLCSPACCAAFGPLCAYMHGSHRCTKYIPGASAWPHAPPAPGILALPGPCRRGCCPAFQGGRAAQPGHEDAAAEEEGEAPGAEDG